ncbi:MAG: DNA polymerase III subunit alpha [Patescibacteria group bacterium]|nr:DNA polymerase III subunit alpha [Patescibacteria group bacterium]
MPDNASLQKKSDFVHLHVHSMYSLLDAMGDVSDIAARAKELGYDAIALTDHGGLYGAVEFYEACNKQKIKGIFGVEAYIAPNKMTDRRPRIDDRMEHLTLLAETDEGYSNLMRLVSLSFLEGFYYKPRMDKDVLKAYGKGLIALSGCLRGEIPTALKMHDEDKAARLVSEFQEIFGPDNFFLELVHHPESPTQIEVNDLLIKLSKKTGAPLVATKDVHYINASDADAQDALQCIHDGKLLSDVNRYSMSGTDHSLTPPEVMVEAFRDTPEAISNTRLIAERCTAKLELGRNLLPTVEVPDGKTADGYLRELCQQGMKERYPDGASPEAAERLEFELKTIERMGFAAYFLIVHDYVKWAKENGVVVGPGRGSAAGSIASYALKITNLDPLSYGLLFERFLNPDRISMPDIDMDFDDVKRKDVIEYVSTKYGRDRVAGIITFGTMAARAAVRDVGRVLGWTFQEVDRVAKAVPPPVQGRHIPLAKSSKENPELKELYNNDLRVRQLIDLAIKLEGTARHASQHACGIVIAPQPLVELAPLQKAQGGDVEQVIQYSLHSAEASGLLKMDFLGLSNLTIIRDCLEIMQAVHGVEVDIDELPLDDEKTFELFGRGETTGVFQLESDGMKKHIKELRPSQIEDIIAMVALYRPGPMQFIESFIARKHGREKISYAHPLLENALKNTYGIPVYQEQVMQVSKDMAGFTGGEADTLRKAMGKKIAKLMAEMRVKFIEGSVRNGVEWNIAEEIFNQFEEFAAYGFNKSHAACYAMIAYQTAYLKAHWPECFMAALLNSDSQNLDRITIEVEECRRIGLEVLPPDINESFAGFSVVKGTNKIRFGLQAIKGLGQDVVEAMVRERKKNGAYKDLADFISRVPGKSINRKSLECLIRSGALDRFGDRNELFFNIEAILDYHRTIQLEASTGQVNLFASSPSEGGKAPFKLKPTPPAARRDLLAWEKELLGLYVSEHPFKEYGERLAGLLTPIAKAVEKKQAKKLRIGGVVTLAKKILTKKNEPMAFARLDDGEGEIEVVVFPRVLRDKPEIWEADKILVVSGRVSDKDGKVSFIAETAFEVTSESIDEVAVFGSEPDFSEDGQKIAEAQLVSASTGNAVTLTIRAKLPDSLLLQLRRVLDAHPGRYPVFFEIEDENGTRRVKSTSRVEFSDIFVRELESFLGKDTVKLGG